MKLHLLSIILLVAALCHSQERKYFTKFKPTEYVCGFPTFGCYWGKPTDSLKIELKILQTKVVNGMECTSFELKYKGDKVVFWIGVKDSVMYTFKRNKLKKPLKMFDFKQKEVKKDNVYFFPFSDNADVSEPYSEIVENDRFFELNFKDYKSFFTLDDLEFYSIEISLQRGVFFDARKAPDYDLIYTDLEEI